MYARTLPFLIIEGAVTTTTASALLTSTVGFEVVRSEFSSDQKAPKDSGRDFRDSFFTFLFGPWVWDTWGCRVPLRSAFQGTWVGRQLLAVAWQIKVPMSGSSRRFSMP